MWEVPILNKYRICVYAICKNEEKFVKRWMDSMNEADQVIVIDTGSSDNTVKLLKEEGAIVYEETISPWRFDVARNISLSYVPDNVDICVCTDLDEVFESGWRNKLEESWKKNATMGNYWYNWSLNEDGTPGTQLVYFKVHTKKDYKWEAPVHEYLKFIGKQTENKVFIEGMVLNHFPDQSKPRSSYLPLLELAVSEKPDDDRNMFYLGREYMYAKQWDNCIATLNKHLNLPKSVWKEERCASMRCIAEAYKSLGDYTNSSIWYYRAIGECPHMRDPYVEFALLAYSQKDWLKVLFLITEALKINTKSKVYVNKSYSWDHTIYDLGGIACYWLKMYKESAQFFRNAITLNPNNQRLQKNLSFALEKLQ